ncbi:hypothetical protein MS3_00000849 [Schistosoma haematobium]|uniref:Uncharacterized protein n=1 Tax=Schistosoma haematobium TaxID=6185 RepID=A0A922S6G6_SCHHA|nr:hypothetical protein MS3_00000849 [Schistosoma haematobium]KAH9595640.1 hypothetical protein MS3_00000849 [Schistosoma haematobium]
MNIIQCYSSANESSDDDRNQFCEKQQSVMAKCLTNHLTMMIGERNAEVRMNNNRYEDITGRNGLTRRKEREWGEIGKSVCILQIGYRRHNIPTQMHTQSHMSLSGSHHGEPDRSYLHKQNIHKDNQRRGNQKRS